MYSFIFSIVNPWLLSPDKAIGFKKNFLEINFRRVNDLNSLKKLKKST